MIAAAIIAMLAVAPASAATRVVSLPETSVNKGVVQLETSRAAGISVRIAEDLANIIDDGGDAASFAGGRPGTAAEPH